MKLQVNLKLKLSKIVKKIIVKYNTFEKATYDQYLLSSLKLRAKNIDEVHAYIDEITGSGSLNAHFKKIYNEIDKLTGEQLQRIMKSSMFPVLKIDKNNSYEFYPELNCSMFRHKYYEGDFGAYEDVGQRLIISADIIDLSIEDGKLFNRPEPYNVIMQNNSITVKLSNSFVEMEKELFENLLAVDLDSISKYEGKIHKTIDANRWNALDNMTINNLYSNNIYYYDEDGNHCKIRGENVVKTKVANINSLYICQETVISTNNNPELCNRVISELINKNALKDFSVTIILRLIKNIDEVKAQTVINYLLGRNDNMDLAIYGVKLLRDGLLKNWTEDSLKCFLKYSGKDSINYIYKANPKMNYDISQLLLLEKELLNNDHKKQVEEYYKSVEQMKLSIKTIVGDITTRGLRESAKKLKADNDTKKFSKLCNKLIGHVSNDIDKVSHKELKNWLSEAIILQELSKVIDKKINN